MGAILVFGAFSAAAIGYFSQFANCQSTDETFWTAAWRGRPAYYYYYYYYYGTFWANVFWLAYVALAVVPARSMQLALTASAVMYLLVMDSIALTIAR